MFFFKLEKYINQFISINRRLYIEFQVQSKTQKRTSQFASKIIQKRDGSMTVEAALVFPLFLFALYVVLCVSHILITSHEIQNGLTETARYAAKYAYTEKESVMSESVLKWQFMKYVDEESLFYISGKAKGMRIMCCGEDRNEDVIRLQADAKLTLAIPFFSTYKIPIQEVVYQKKFIGYRDGESGIETGEYVYVAETGSVYHTSLSCSHICIQVIPASAVTQLDKRTCCKHCMKDGRLHGDYATIYGDCIHNNINCSGIKRTIRLVKKEQITGMPMCTKCALNTDN